MDVSNSTDQNTGYRVVGAGGNIRDLPGVAPEQDRVKIKNQTFVKIDKKWYELLAEGNIEPYTYITLKPRKRPFLVEFVRIDGSKPRCNVPEVTVTTPTAQADFLISLMPNGKGAKTCACKWKKG
jgi:hypothetical protein